MKTILLILIIFVSFPIFADWDFGFHTKYNEIQITYSYVNFIGDDIFLHRIEIHFYKIDSHNIYIELKTRNIRNKNGNKQL